MSRTLALLAGLVLLAACGSAQPASGSTTVAVVAGENFWGSLAAELGGSKVSVQSVVTDPNADPTSTRPAPPTRAPSPRPTW